MGPEGSGKSTFIRSISEVAVLSSERDIYDHTRTESSARTSAGAIDFGRITVAPDVQLHLFSAPTESEELIWDAITDGILGLVLIVDATRKETYPQGRDILERFRGFGSISSVVAVNKRDSADSADMEETRRILEIGDEVPVLPLNASDRESVKEVLLALLYTVLAEVEGGRVVVSS